MPMYWREPIRRRRALVRAGRSSFVRSPRGVPQVLAGAALILLLGLAGLLLGWISASRFENVLILVVALPLGCLALLLLLRVTHRNVQLDPTGFTVWDSAVSLKGLFGRQAVHHPLASIRLVEVTRIDAASGPFPAVVLSLDQGGPVALALSDYEDPAELQRRMHEWGYPLAQRDGV